jgi:SAM-dependent MidA family methyltransferase
LNHIKDKQHIEISPQRAMMIQSMSKHLMNYGGSALIGDYGHWGGKGDTFRVCLYFFELIRLIIISIGFS